MRPLLIGLKMTTITSQVQSNYEHPLCNSNSRTDIQRIYNQQIMISGKCRMRD